MRAIGAASAAVDAVVKGEASNAFAAVRPPGHHAETARAMGFCLFNTVAIAARYAQKAHGLERAAIVDWDVHHGNGTQDIFYTSERVLYCSIHQSPLYPGTGHREEIGAGPGFGLTLNVPLPPGADDRAYLHAFDLEILPRVRDFRPQLLFISAGYDAHRDDPLAMQRVTEAGFTAMTRRVKRLAEECCDGRLVLILEGGYHLDALARSVAATLRALDESAVGGRQSAEGGGR